MHNRLAEFRHLAGISQESLATVTVCISSLY